MVISTSFALLICIAYARWHKGTDWPGIVLGACFGASLGGGPFKGVIDGLNDAIALGINEGIRFISSQLGGGNGGNGPAATTPPLGVILRYNLGLIGIGR